MLVNENNFQIDNIFSDSDNGENIKIRDYINSAVYIEKIYNMGPAVCNNSVCMHFVPTSDNPKFMRVKKCLCFTNPKECPCHPYHNHDENNEMKLKTLSDHELSISETTYCKQKTPESDIDSGISVKRISTSPPIEEGEYKEDLHLSLSSLTSTTTLPTVRLVEEEERKHQAYLKWCTKKDIEKKTLIEIAKRSEMIKKQERDDQLAKERENFKKWLSNKKLIEEQSLKLLKKREDEERSRKAEEEEKRTQLNKISYQLWVKRKEETILENKLKEKLEKLKCEQDKQKRLEYSKKAYGIWLQQSKYKPKPLPVGRGLDSLKSSVSVAFINPVPWTPNVDIP